MKNWQLVIFLALMGVGNSAEAKSGFESVQVIKHSGCPRSDWPAGNHIPPLTYPSGGLFFELEDGQVCFFTSAQYRHFRAVLDIGSKEASEKFLLWNPKTRRSKTVMASIKFQGDDHITVNGTAVTHKSLERLRLTKDWEKVLQGDWPHGCSIVNLGHGKFLVSGGMSKPYSPGPMYFTKAMVYNSLTDSVEKTLEMLSGRAFHSSVLLANGTVFCVGGRTESIEMGTHISNSAEILDFKNGQVIGIGDKLPIGLCDTTISKDSHGNPIIFGGLPNRGFSSKRIFCFDLVSRRFVEAGTLREGRHFHRAAKAFPDDPETKLTEVVETYVERLGNGQFVIDGGVYIQASPIADFASGDRDTAEIIREK